MDSVLEAIGNTPLIRLRRLEKDAGLDCELYAKCEFLSAGGSIKDRIGLRMLEEAETSGRIAPGCTLVEPTSGNTGIGIALAALIKGYRVITVMPQKMSGEKIDVLRALGAEIVRTPTEAAWDSPESHLSVAKRLAAELPNACMLDQYTNRGNPLAHFDGTAAEILAALDSRLDLLVAGAGTGGTITGLAWRIKAACPACVIVAADPVGSILAQPAAMNEMGAGDGDGSYKVEGIGYDFVPDVLGRAAVDRWVKTRDGPSFAAARRLMRLEGLLVGGSSGAAICALLESAKGLPAGSRAVVMLPDSCRNYMTKFVSPDWMAEHFPPVESPGAPGPTAQWWAGRTVRDLPLPAPATADPGLSCAAVAALMRAQGIDQVPVVDAAGAVVGVATEGDLLASLAAKRASPSDPVAKVAFKSFKQVGLATPLAALSRLLDRDSFVLVTAAQRLFSTPGDVAASGAGGGPPSRAVVLSILTRIDLLDYIMKGAPAEGA